MRELKIPKIHIRKKKVTKPLEALQKAKIEMQTTQEFYIHIKSLKNKKDIPKSILYPLEEDMKTFFKDDSISIFDDDFIDIVEQYCIWDLKYQSEKILYIKSFI